MPVRPTDYQGEAEPALAHRAAYGAQAPSKFQQ